MKELLDAVLNAPDDDAPRLVYADALMAQGDVRGELIQVQCALKSQRGETAKLLTRERALLEQNREKWEAPFKGAGLVWSRGFPEVVIGSAKELVKALPICVEQAPIRSVVITSVDRKSFAELVTLSAVDQIAELEIAGSDRHEEWSIGDAGAAALAHASMKALRRLTLGASHIGVDGAAEIALAAWTMKLTKLAIGGNVVNPNLIAALTSVRELSIQGNSVPCRVLNADIERLRLSECHLVGALPALSKLHTLILDSCRIGDEGALEIARGRYPKLAVLRLDHNGITDVGAAALAATELPLVELNLSNNYIKATGAKALAESTALSKLMRLDLQDNQLRVEGITALVDGKGLPRLRELGVSRNGLDPFTALQQRFASKPHLKIL